MPSARKRARPAWEKTALGKLLVAADLNQSTGAKALGLSSRQMRRYVAGKPPMPRTVELALQHLIRERKGKV